MKTITVYYDNECPFCSEYSKFIKLQSIYNVVLINARECHEEMQFFSDKNMNINDGFIIEFKDTYLQGDEAVVFLSKSINAKSFLGRLFVNLMGNKYFMSFVYPIVKVIRIILLLLIGKNYKIEIK